MPDKIFKSSNYPNLLDKIGLTSSGIRNQIEVYPLEFLQNRNKDAEWNIGFPMFIPSFYQHIIEYGTIPTQETFYANYLELNKTYFAQNKHTQEILTGLKARAYRTYPSVVRDIHFSLYMREILNTTTTVVYNLQLDIEEGIDVMLIHNEAFYGVNLYTQTNRAVSSRTIKEHRHEKFSNVRYVELPVPFNGSIQCGQFFLYGERELNALRQRVGLV